MELYPGEISNLRKLITKWITFTDLELEATFSGARDTTTFLSIAQRLKAKGFEALPQEDRMNILTPQRVRFTLTGMHDIEEYCKDDSLENKTYEAMIKDKSIPDSNLDIAEYGVRVKVRREVEIDNSEAQLVDMLSRWKEQKKAFRIMRRWTFLGKGIRIDMSMVRSTPVNTKGEFLWQNTFRQRDITKTQANFEVEVELLRPEAEVTVSADYAEIALKQLIVGIGEVLRGIQKHPVLIRKSIAEKAKEAYKELTGVSVFRGNAPITMEKVNMLKTAEKNVPNIRSGYNVTDKADGLRMMGYVDSRGELFMIDMSLNIYRTGLKKQECRDSLVDGEYVTQDRDKNPLSQYLVFDIYYAPEKKDVTKEAFAGTSGSNAASEPSGRYGFLQNWVERWNSGDGPVIMPGLGVTQKNKIEVLAKTFLFAKEGDDSIFKACASVLDTASLYYTDGLILTPNSAPLPQHPGSFEGQFKWKPSEDNTVDFLVLFDKDPYVPQVDMVTIGVKPETGENVRYKTMHLYVGADRDPAYQDPRGTVLFEQPLPDEQGKQQRKGKSKVQPVLFNPKELPDTMANVSFRTVQEDYLTHEEFCSCENGDPIQDRSVVECKYDGHAPPGWRWIPIRVRYDKTERFQRGEKGGIMNRDFSAESVWNSIHDPITLHMIRTGSERPSDDEITEMSGEVAGVVRGDVAKVYYDRQAPKEDIQLIKGLREFHRIYIKEGLLLKTGLHGGNKTFVDLACGQGGDIQSWIRMNAKFCYGTDIAGFGIRDPQNGAYRRYLNAVIAKPGKYNDVPRMIFTIGSSAKRLSTGEAGATKEESNIMRSLYGVVSPDGPIPPFVRKYGENQLRDGADCVACMFAIHYLFESEQTLAGIMQNISDTLKVGGLFVGCCFDGQRIFDALRGLEKGASLVGKEGNAEIWRITKRYEAKDLIIEPASEGLGLGIDVEFISIGTTQREYLVPFKLLENKMAEIGCNLMTPEECKALGLKNSTATFDESFEMAEKAGKKYVMTSDVKRYSFFNRWFIFKRRREGPLGEIEEGEGEIEVAPSSLEAVALSETRPSALGEVVVADEGREAAIRTAVSSSVAATAAAATAAAPTKLLLFSHDTDKTKDQLGIKKKDAKGKDVVDKYAVRWLAPIAPFPITDPESKVVYPSIEHYLAAMKLKIAGKNPDLAVGLFAQEGTIHQAFLNERAKKKVSEDEDQTLLKEERQRVLKESDSNYLRKSYKINIDEGAWLAIRNDILAEAVKQRWETDKRFQDIVNTAKQQGFYLLHYGGPAGGSWLGGKKAVGGGIEGENALGLAIMRAAGFRGM